MPKRDVRLGKWPARRPTAGRHRSCWLRLPPQTGARMPWASKRPLQKRAHLDRAVHQGVVVVGTVGSKSSLVHLQRGQSGGRSPAARRVAGCNRQAVVAADSCPTTRRHTLVPLKKPRCASSQAARTEASQRVHGVSAPAGVWFGSQLACQWDLSICCVGTGLPPWVQRRFCRCLANSRTK